MESPERLFSPAAKAESAAGQEEMMLQRLAEMKDALLAYSDEMKRLEDKKKAGEAYIDADRIQFAETKRLALDAIAFFSEAEKIYKTMLQKSTLPGELEQ